MTVTLLEGHVVSVLEGLPAGHFHTVVTSPPYAWLRAYSTEPQVWQTADGDALCAPEQHEWGAPVRPGNYNWGEYIQATGNLDRGHQKQVMAQRSAFCVHCHAWRGELGQEPTIELYVEHLVAVFRAVKRVLRADGTLWVNLAGCYFNDPGGQNGGAGNTLDYGAGRVSPKVMEANRQNGRQKRGRHPWLKPLDWVDVPGLFARAMQQDGWTWRSDVVWVKPSALPESVSGTRWERCRVLAQGQEKRGAQIGAINGYVDGEASKSIDRLEPARWADCPGCPKCAPDGLVLRRGSGRPTKSTERVLLFTRGPGYYFDQEAVREENAPPTQNRFVSERRSPAKEDAASQTPHSLNRPGADYTAWSSNGRNLRDWWVIGPSPLKDEHYAAYPPELPSRCIRAGTSEWGCCPGCGAPWARVITHQELPRSSAPTSDRAFRTEQQKAGGMLADPRTQGIPRDYASESTTLGWRPTCPCGEEQAPVPCRVLDPFGGSGTTAVAANRLGRDCTLVELKPQYLELARKRVGRAPLSLFAWQGQEALAASPSRSGSSSSPASEAPKQEPVSTKQERHPNRTVAGFNQRYKAKQKALEDDPHRDNFWVDEHGAVREGVEGEAAG